VFTRVICDGATQFDSVPTGYSGPLPSIIDTLTVSIDLHGVEGSDIIGWRARRHAGLVDLRGIAAHQARDYWEPLYAPNGQLVLDPEEFYILASQEAVSIPHDQAAEMAPIAPEIGRVPLSVAGVAFV